MTAMLTLRQTVLQDLDDAGRVLVTNDDSGSMQLLEVAADGSLRRLTDLAEPIAAARYLPGSRQVVVSVNPAGSERTQLSLLDLSGDGELPDLEPMVHDPAYIHELLDVAADTVFYATNRRDGVEFDIVMRTVSDGTESVLYDKGGSFEQVRVSPDGAVVAATRMTLVAASSQLLVIDTASGEVRELSDPTTPGDWAEPSWLPRGDLVVSSDSGVERFEVRRWHAADGSWIRELSDADADLVAIPAPDGRTWAVVRSSGAIETLSLQPATGDPVALPLPGIGAVTMYNPIRWSHDGTCLGFTFSSPASPPEAYTWSPGDGIRRRTTSNRPELLPQLTGPEFHTVESFDGEQIPVFITRGHAADRSAVVHVHGGPEAQAKPAWNPIIAALALDGHTVVIPNVRGSAGYGRRWVSLDDIDKRLDSVRDLAAVRDWLPSQGVDADRIALMGGSYGGYMTLAGLTFEPARWTCGVDIVGMSSLVTFLENTSDYRRAYREREYGSLAHDRATLEAASPLSVIDRLAVPLFVIHGRNDPRVPLSEAEQVTAAVRANGAECELLVYDDEGHGLVKRKNRLDAYPRAAAFLSRHLA